MPSLTPLSRRAWLMGAGACIALPWLEAMTPLDRSASAAGDDDVRRLLIWIMCGGAHQPAWQVSGVGPGYAVGQTLEPLAAAALTDDVTVVTGTHNGFADAAAGHGQGCGALLTGVDPGKDEVRAGVSFDQLVAQHLQGSTPIPSLQFGTADPVVQSADGYPPSYNHRFCWADETTLLPNETEPAAMFERLVGTAPAGGGADGPDTRGLSVLDTVLADAERLHARLGVQDRQRLEQYQTHVREIEQRIQAGPVECDVDGPPPAGVPAAVEEHLRLIHDMVTLAFRCDLSRVVVLAYDSSASFANYGFLGVSGGYHLGTIHHSNDPAKMDDYATVNRWMVERYADLLTQLRQTPDAAGAPLLDSCAAMLCSEHGEGNEHRTVDLPVLIAGRAAGAIVPGQHLALPGEPFANVGIALMQAMGIDIDHFGLEGTRAAPGILA